MTSRHARSGNVTALRWGARRRTRLLSVWLLRGWVAFWFATAAYPCHRIFGTPGDRVEPAALVLAAAAQSFPASVCVDSHPAHQNSECQNLTAAVPGVSISLAAATDSLDFNLVALPASSAYRLPRAAYALTAYTAPQPPHAPLYLRTQRLLI